MTSWSSMSLDCPKCSLECRRTWSSQSSAKEWRSSYLTTCGTCLIKNQMVKRQTQALIWCTGGWLTDWVRWLIEGDDWSSTCLKKRAVLINLKWPILRQLGAKMKSSVDSLAYSWRSYWIIRRRTLLKKLWPVWFQGKVKAYLSWLRLTLKVDRSKLEMVKQLPAITFHKQWTIHR